MNVPNALPFLVPTLYSQGRVRHQPITVNGLLEYSKELLNVYMDPAINMEAVGKVGIALATIYKLGEQHYLGKVNPGSGLIQDSPYTPITATREDLALAAILEKISYDFYKELGKGLFKVPSSFLSVQPLSDRFHLTHQMATGLVNIGVNSCIRILSRFPAVKDYQDFSQANTKSFSGDSIGFMEYVHSYRKPPETLLAPDGSEKPLLGLMELLAVMRALGDIDGLGGLANNAGFKWIKDEQGQIIAAQTVKIDPGCAFSFNEEDKVQCTNFVLNTNEGLGPVKRWLRDLRDLQIAKNDQRMTIQWAELSEKQKDLFLSTLISCLRYKNNHGVLDLLIYRQGKFKNSKTEKLPKAIGQKLLWAFNEWLTLQEEIYTKELTDYRIKYPLEVLQIHYLDRWGDLSVPMTKETFPVRELFTQLALKSGEAQDKELLQDGPESLIPINKLFDNNQGKPIRRILIRGNAGVGKSTLCQKVAHDWACGQLFTDLFKAVYWIPLRILNRAVEPGGSLANVNNPDLFLAKTLAELVLNQPGLTAPLLNELKIARRKILIILDGYDEANAILRQVLASLLADPQLHLLITSRPLALQLPMDQIDRFAEILGFTDGQVKDYCQLFFRRKGETVKTRKVEKEFLSTLHSRHHLLQLARTPLQLQMLCTLWEATADRNAMGDTLTNLYFTMVERLFECESLIQEKGSKPMSVEEKDHLYDVIGKLALQGLSQGMIMLPHEKIEPLLKQENLAWTDLFRSGLLKTAGVDENLHCYFLHLSLQEYLTARYVSRLSIDQQRICIADMIGQPSFSLTLAFLAGEIHRIDLSKNKESLHQFFLFLCSQLKNLPAKAEAPAWLLPFRCLNECPDYVKPLPELEQCIQNQPTIHINDPAWNTHLSATHWVAREGLARAFQWLVKQRGAAIISQCDSLERSPFYFAAAGGNLELLQWLHQQDATLIQKTKDDGTNPLHIAALHGHVPLMEWLYQKDPRLLRSRNDGRNAMHNAAQNGHLEAMKWLYHIDPQSVQSLHSNGCTAMHYAALGGHLTVMVWLNEQDPTFISKVSQQGITPMHLAAQYGHLAAMEWLYDKDPILISKANNQRSETPIHLAAKSGALKAVKWLYDKDPLLIAKLMHHNMTPMHAAAHMGQLALMEWLHEKDPLLISKAADEGITPMHIAAQFGQLTAMEWLHVKDPSFITKISNTGQTVMHSAALGGQIEGMLWLYLRNPSLLTQVNEDGKTTMDVAAEYGQLAVMEWLHVKDPTLILKTHTNHTTPMHTAAQYGQLSAMEWLYEKQPSLLLSVKLGGWAPMHTAAEVGQLEAVQWLYAKNPSLSKIKSQNQWMPMHNAAFKGHQSVMEWLTQQDPSLREHLVTDELASEAMLPERDGKELAKPPNIKGSCYLS